MITASARRAVAALAAVATSPLEDQPTARLNFCFDARLLAVFFCPSAGKHGPGVLSPRRELEFAGRRAALTRLSDAVAAGAVPADGDLAVLRELADVAKEAA